MKRFAFPLERVRQWRSLQVDLEFTRLQKLFDDRARLDQYAAELERQVRKAEYRLAAAVAAGNGVDGGQLSRLDDFHIYANRQRHLLTAQREEIDRQIDEQRRRLIGARRDFLLLERLKQKARQAWDQEYSKELESLAGELYLARWQAK